MIGRQLSHYEVIEEISRGGMGIVYRARDVKLNREVALKTLPAELVSDANRKRRFMQEAQAAAALKHPNVAVIYEVDDDDGVTFIAMELVEGRALADLLQAGRLPLPRCLELGADVAAGLGAAHGKGIVHRDLKPANIMVTEEGHAKIIDFGVAKLIHRIGDDASESPTILRGDTKPGDVIGTVPYMSPEQARGLAVDHRSDLFSLGTIVYQMATGRHPFEAASAAGVLSSILRDAPPSVSQLDPELPPSLDGILSRCLEKDPGRRYQRAEDFRTDIASLARASTADTHGPKAPRDAGKSAFERQAWREAYEQLSKADAREELSAEDLERLAEAAWWVGRSDECLRARERAYTAHLKVGAEGRAAMVALLLAEDFFHKLAKSVGSGWLKRAERLLERLPEAAEHGYWSRTQSRLALERGDAEVALRNAEQALALATRFDDLELQALALQDRGGILVSTGEVTEGMALIDEAMAIALSGEVGPRTVGRIYCNMMAVCEKLTDFRRAREWTEAAHTWCEPHTDSGYHGICRVRRAELLRLRGSWQQAEEDARRACEEMKEFLSDVSGEAYYEIGEIRLRMGDLAEAEKAYRAAHELGREPLPGLALVRMAEGKLDDSLALMERALAEGARGGLDRARLLPAYVEILVAARRPDDARAAVEEMESIAELYGTQALRANAAFARGALTLSSGQLERAVQSLRGALKLYRELDLPYEAGRTRTLLGMAYTQLGSDTHADLELRAAKSAFEELGAKRDLDEVLSLLAKGPPGDRAG